MERENAIVERHNRRVLRVARLHLLFQSIGLVGLLLLSPTLIYVDVTVTARTTTLDFIDYLFIAAFSVLVVSIVGMLVVRLWWSTHRLKWRQRTVETLTRLSELRERHPELVLLNEVSELLEEEKAEAEGQRSFWVNMAVNLFFTLLGFALSYTATKLGWLR